MECIHEKSQIAKSHPDNVSRTRKAILANSAFELTPLPKIYVVWNIIMNFTASFPTGRLDPEVCIFPSPLKSVRDSVVLPTRSLLCCLHCLSGPPLLAII